jgi:hypothetical protein
MGIEKSNGNSLKYMPAWRTKKAIEVAALGDDLDSFEKIPALLERMVQADPTDYYHVQSQDGSFQQLFIPPGAAIKSFQHCRPFIALDGAFWKNRWDITLLIACIRDGNDEIIPLAWGVVPSESKDGWGFFLSHFLKCYPTINSPQMTIIR